MGSQQPSGLILKWKKCANTRTMARAGCPVKLSNRGRMASVKEVSKNSLVTGWAPVILCGRWGKKSSGRTTIIAALHQFGLYGRVARWKPECEKLDFLVWWNPDWTVWPYFPTVVTVKHSDGSIVVWDCFCSWQTGQYWGKSQCSKVNIYSRYPELSGFRVKMHLLTGQWH